MDAPLVSPHAPLLPLIFVAAFLALAAVFGMACQNLRSGARGRQPLVLVVAAGALAYYATRRIPVGPELWLVLVPAGLFFAVVGFYAGVGIKASHRPSMEEQIRELTGTAPDWDDLRPERDWHRGRRRP